MIKLKSKVKKNTMQITCQEDMINVGQARESEYPLGPFNVADYLWHAVKKRACNNSLKCVVRHWRSPSVVKATTEKAKVRVVGAERRIS